MLRHVVMWKMNGEDAAARAAQAEECAAALRDLPAEVPTLEHLEVHIDSLGLNGSWDVVLITDFKDEEALDAYVVHPAHVAAAAVIKERAAARAAVDANY